MNARSLFLTTLALLSFFSQQCRSQEPTLRATLEGHTKGVVSLAFSPDGETLASGSRDSTVKLWNTKKNTLLGTLIGHTSHVFALAFSPDGKLLATSAADQSIRFWDLNTFKETAKIDLNKTERIFTLTFSPDGKTLLSGGLDKCIRFWDVQTKKNTHTTEKGSMQIWRLVYSPDGKFLAANDVERQIRLYDAKTLKVQQTFKSDDMGDYRCMAFTPDSKMLLGGGGGEGAIKLWDLAKGKITQTFTYKGRIHQDAMSLAISADGKSFAAGHYDYAISLWDLESGVNLAVLKGHTGWIWSVAYSKDGKILASASDDGTIKLWDIPVEDKKK